MVRALTYFSLRNYILLFALMQIWQYEHFYNYLIMKIIRGKVEKICECCDFFGPGSWHFFLSQIVADNSPGQKIVFITLCCWCQLTLLEEGTLSPPTAVWRSRRSFRTCRNYFVVKNKKVHVCQATFSCRQKCCKSKTFAILFFFQITICFSFHETTICTSSFHRIFLLFFKPCFVCASTIDPSLISSKDGSMGKTQLYKDKCR